MLFILVREATRYEYIASVDDRGRETGQAPKTVDADSRRTNFCIHRDRSKKVHAAF